jgi:hypothetical protein
MPSRSSKKKRQPDPNTLAFGIVQALTGEPPPAPPEEGTPAAPAKNPAAVALGKLGGAKGGKARAAKLSAKKRKEIAKKAARARWSNRPSSSWLGWNETTAIDHRIRVQVDVFHGFWNVRPENPALVAAHWEHRRHSLAVKSSGSVAVCIAWV